MALQEVLFTIAGFPVSILASVLLFTWLLFLWENYLNIRQRNVAMRNEQIPSSLRSLMDVSAYHKARLYSIDKINFELINGVYNILQITVILYFGIFAWLWYTSQAHVVYLNTLMPENFRAHFTFGKESEILCSMLVIFYISIFSLVDSLPWSLYRNFVIEARYGFNKQTIGFFFKDKLKGFLVNMLLGLPISAILIWIIKLGGDYFCLYAYVFSLSVSLILMFIYPEFIAPLFDRYERFPDCPLRTKIEELAASISFPLKKLLVVEGSKRSSHSNAYFYGFGSNKRIVLFDTLIKGFKLSDKSKTEGEAADIARDADTATQRASESEHDDCLDRGCEDDDEILAVLAHELGHWQLNHTTKFLVMSQVNLLLMFIVFQLLIDVEPLFTSFGFLPSTTPILLRLIIIFQFVFMPYNAVLNFLITLVSRRFEFQADAFAVGLKPGEKLKNCLIVLTKDNLSFPVYDPLYSLFNLSHPPLLERFQAIDEEVKKQK
uniref:CAAX prenyl protease n=1 Tax=Schistocephalus solidus TaxID=70667 RepID=A0A0X3PJI0_SCHSO